MKTDPLVRTPSSREPVHDRRGFKKVGLFPFIFVMYSYTTAGPFGLEDQVRTSGPGMSLIYQMVIPLFWSLPISLVAAELTTAMPVEGGFYRWTREAFGDFWGFLAGWWNWFASFFLGASYAVLFTDYVAPYFPRWSELERYLVGVIVVALIAWVNVRGIRVVGSVATLLELGILAIILLMSILSARMWHLNPFRPLVPPNRSLFEVFGVGFALGLWLYAGYEQLSSVAEEVENPQRSYPRALAWVLPLSMATYLVPTASTLAALGNWQDWHDGYFSQAAALIGGPWLRLAVTLAAATMALSILNSMVLSTTRMPFAMAEDGYMSPALARLHPRYGTPWLAIIVSALVYCLLAWHSLAQLISIYIWLRIATSILTVVSAWRLRQKHPDWPRSFRIPWGKKGLLYSVAAPIVMSAIALIASDRFALRWGPLALLLGPVAYVFLKRRSRRQLTQSSSL